MLTLVSEEISVLVSAAYKRFEEILQTGDKRLSGFERAVGASSPDVKKFVDFLGFGARNQIDRPIYELRDALLSLLRDKIELLEADIFPNGPPLQSLLATDCEHVLRMTCYPASVATVVNHPHTDIDLVTLLPAATAPGLEVKVEDGWHPFNVRPQEILALPGDFATLLGGSSAVTHRVAYTSQRRLSVSMFVNADKNLDIGGRSVRTILDDRLRTVLE